MLKEPHHLEFPEDSFRANQALEHVWQFLQRDPLPVPGVGDGPHHTEGAVADGPVGLVVIAVAWRKEKRNSIS